MKRYVKVIVTCRDCWYYATLDCPFVDGELPKGLDECSDFKNEDTTEGVK